MKRSLNLLESSEVYHINRKKTGKTFCPIKQETVYAEHLAILCTAYFLGVEIRVTTEDLSVSNSHNYIENSILPCISVCI